MAPLLIDHIGIKNMALYYLVIIYRYYFVAYLPRRCNREINIFSAGRHIMPGNNQKWRDFREGDRRDNPDV